MNGMTNIAAQVVLESAREMFCIEPARLREGLCQHEFHDLQDVFTLLNGLEDEYGPSGAHGLTQRFGGVIFRVGLKELGGQAGFRSIDYRMLPSPRRVEVGLSALARMAAETTSAKVTVSADDTHWYWRAEDCQECRDRLTPGPCCFALVGLIQEFAAWASGGRFHRVTETECRAAGAAACVICIDKKPLD